MDTSFKIDIPNAVLNILNTLNSAGFDAYIVGGCVRDSVLRRAVNDWDITTNALPGEVKKLFAKCVDTGIAHGTVTVITDSFCCEVTTYRIDGKYLDSRRPESVTYTSSLEEDLARRDFTVNAMAYHPESGIIDLYGGVRDLNLKLIRCVNDPVLRFSEDALRMLRALRFCAQLGFCVEENTFHAITTLFAHLNDISAERISAELIKILTSDYPRNLSLLINSGILKIILPELLPMVDCAQNHPYHTCDVWSHTIDAIAHVEPKRIQKAAAECAKLLWNKDSASDVLSNEREAFLRYAFTYVRVAMLFHDCGKPACKTTDSDGVTHFKGHPKVSAQICKSVLSRLRLPVKLINTVYQLVNYHDHRFPTDIQSVKRAVIEVGKPEFALLLEVRHADISAHSTYQQAESFKRLAALKSQYYEILSSDDCIDLAHLAVNGDSLKAIGITDGRIIGSTLQFLLDTVIDHPDYNYKEKLLALAMERI